jgi:PDZ domain-containing protein
MRRAYDALRRMVWWLGRTPYGRATLAALLPALAIGTLFLIPTPYQVLLPGPVTDVQRLIQPYPKPIKGTLYLTTIYSDPASVGEWLYAKLTPDAGIVPREQARPPDLNEREYQKVLTQMMDESKVAAKVVALREAGYDVKITGQGAQVQDIQDSSKAKGILQAQDVIVALDSERVATSTDLIAMVQGHKAGETVQMTVQRADKELTLAVPLGESPDEPGRARVGIVVLTHLYQYDLPKEVNLQTRDIGGNSAGLMFALGIYNAVAPTDITGGHKIAGTGTISTDGRVGAIGGAKYKVRAAEKAGAELFLSPPDNFQEASAAAKHVRVVAAPTFKDALATLAALPPVS